MSILLEHLPVFIIIVPLFVAFILPTLAKKIRLVESLVVLTGVVLLAGAVYLAVTVSGRAETIVYQMGGWAAPWGIELKVDSLSAFFILVVSAVSLPVSLYAVNNLQNDLGGPAVLARFFVLYLLLLGSLCGMALTNDLFNVFVLVEVATLSCCGLVSAQKSATAAEASFSYLIQASIGSAFILGGIGFVYILTGHLNMDFVAANLKQALAHSPQVVWLALVFFLIGFGIKAALLPLHAWLPAAHASAPAPASALLSALAVKGYFLCLLKIFFRVFGWQIITNLKITQILLFLGTLAIIGGSLLALAQSELKRRLAYSTVAQMGYLFLGLSLASEVSVTGLLLYLAGHALLKAILFLCAGALAAQSPSLTRVSQLSGVGRQMPWTMTAFTTASLGLVGLPLLPGFIGKWYLLSAGLAAGRFIALAVIIVGSILAAGYLLPVVYKAFFLPAAPAVYWDPPFVQKVALAMLTLTALLLGTWPAPLIELARRAAAQLITNR